MISSKLLSFLLLPFSNYFSAVDGIQVWGHSPLSWRKFENPPPAAETVKGEIKQDGGANQAKVQVFRRLEDSDGLEERLQPKCPLGWAKSGDGAQCFKVICEGEQCDNWNKAVQEAQQEQRNFLMTRGSLGWLKEKDGQTKGKVRARFRVLLQSTPETKGSEKSKKMMVVVVGFERQKNSITKLFRKK